MQTHTIHPCYTTIQPICTSKMKLSEQQIVNNSKRLFTKEMKRIFYLTFGLFVVAPGVLFGQIKKPVFLGLQPGITKEKFYEPNEFDINIIPLVVQFPVSKRADVRITTIGNYHFGTVNGFSDIGIQLITPIYFTKKATTNAASAGFYLGPLVGFGRNIFLILP